MRETREVSQHSGVFIVCVIGGRDEEQVAVAEDLTVFQNRRIKHISCGECHTVFVMQDGTVYSCGNNDHGQLGHDKARTRPGTSNSDVPSCQQHLSTSGFVH